MSQIAPSPVSRVLAGVGLAVAIATISGCQILDPDRGAMRDRSVAPITEPPPASASRPAKPISDAPITEPLNVVVTNGFGSVILRASTDVDRPSVRVRRMDDAEVRGPQDGFVATLSGRTLTVDCPDQGGPMQVEIVVHALTDVTVRNSGGVVVVSGVAGAIDVANGTAERPGDSITVTTGFRLSSAISLGTDRGAVALTMPSGSSGVLNIRGQPMRVNVNARNEAMAQVRLGEGTYAGVANGGEAEMRISAPGPVTVNFR